MAQRTKVLPQAREQASIAVLVFLELLRGCGSDYGFCHHFGVRELFEILANDCFSYGNPKGHFVREIVSNVLRLQIRQLGALRLLGPARCTFLCSSPTSDSSKSRSDVKG